MKTWRRLKLAEVSRVCTIETKDALIWVADSEDLCSSFTEISDDAMKRATKVLVLIDGKPGVSGDKQICHGVIASKEVESFEGHRIEIDHVLVEQKAFIPVSDREMAGVVRFQGFLAGDRLADDAQGGSEVCRIFGHVLEVQRPLNQSPLVTCAEHGSLSKLGSTH
jgi:hypothetical protein